MALSTTRDGRNQNIGRCPSLDEELFSSDPPSCLLYMYWRICGLSSFHSMHYIYLSCFSSRRCITPISVTNSGPTDGRTTGTGAGAGQTGRTWMICTMHNGHSGSTNLGTERHTVCTNPLRSMMSCECAVKSKWCHVEKKCMWHAPARNTFFQSSNKGISVANCNCSG